MRRTKLTPATPVPHGLAITAVAAMLSAIALLIVDPGGTTHRRGQAITAVARGTATTSTAATIPATPPRRTTPKVAHVAQAHITGVGSVTLDLVDPGRTMQLSSGQVVKRTVKTIILYPLVSGGTTRSAAATPPFPLIVFGHGFAVSPAPYYILLRAWARAGYVVAAPIFPLENVNAPGGPNEKDLVNQPGDMSLVIDGVTSATERTGPLAGIVDAGRVAVTGQSDGGDTALAAAYDASVRDARVSAAMILSGAEDPFASAFAMPADGPPLLAIQGTADTINPPQSTYSFYADAAPPKYLLKLIGASHQPPYTIPGAELSDVERMTLAFLDRYLKGDGRHLRQIENAHSAGPGSDLSWTSSSAAVPPA